jgi:sulfate-transporting ATPase
LPTSSWSIGGVLVPIDQVLILAIAVFITLVLWVVYRWTRFGIITTGAAENPLAAAAVGASPGFLATISWSLGGGLAAIAGILIAPLTGLDPVAMTLFVIPALAAALLAGFTSIPLTLASGLFLGITQSEVLQYVHIQGASETLPFIAIIVVLTVRGRSLPLRNHMLDRLPMIGNGRIPWRYVIPSVAIVWWLLISIVPSTWTPAVTTSLGAAVTMLSIVVLTGFAGQVNLAPAAFAGLGAFFAARLVAVEGFPVEAAIPLAILATMVVGVAFAMPALKTRGVNLAIITLGLGVAVNETIFQNANLNGGLAGLEVGPRELFGMSLDPVLTPSRYAVVALIVFVIAALFIARLRRSATGRRFVAVRSSERAAASLGISVYRAKLTAFAVSAALAGVGGILLGFSSYSVTVANGFDPLSSIGLVGYSVIGGVGYLLGPLFGSQLVAGGIGSLLNQVIPQLNEYLILIGGVSVIALLIQDPNGIAHANMLAMNRLKARVDRLYARIGNMAKRRPDPEATAAPSVFVDSAALQAVSNGLVQSDNGSGGGLSGKHRSMSRPDLDVLSATGLTVKLGGIIALADVSISVKRGEIVGLIGPNGAGKTTLVDAITGFVKPNSGTVCLNERGITEWAVDRRVKAGITRTFQTLDLFGEISVRENLLIGVECSSRHRSIRNHLWFRSKEQLSRTAELAVREFKLEPYLERSPEELPYGRRSVVAIARALACDPAFLILDEPASTLAKPERAELAELIKDLARDWQIGVLLIEHDIGFIMEVCDRVDILNTGQMIWRGTPADLVESDQLRSALMGEPMVSHG